MNQTNRFKIFLFLMMLTLVSLQGEIHAQSFNYPSDCYYWTAPAHNSGQVQASQAFSSEKVVNVYIENDIAEEWSNCDTSLNGEITNSDINGYILDIVDKFNIQGNTKKFVFRGVIHVDDYDQGDALFPNNQSSICHNNQIDQTKPFLVIANANGCIRTDNGTPRFAFDDRCSDNGINGGGFINGVIHPQLCYNDDNNTLNDGSAMINLASDLDGRLESHPLSINDCDPDGGASKIYNLGNSGKMVNDPFEFYIEHVLMHEIGHFVFGLNHVIAEKNDPNDPDVAMWDSVLNSPHQIKHLHPFDRVCGPLMTPAAKTLAYEHIVRSNPTATDNDGTWGNISILPGFTSRGFLSGGFSEIWDEYFIFYMDDSLKGYWANTSLSLSNYPLNLVIDPYPFGEANQRPVIFSTRELTSQNSLSRILVTDPIVNPLKPIDEPRPAELINKVVYKSTDNPYNDGEDGTLFECMPNQGSECRALRQIRTHIPMTGTWNDKENMTIMASVQTDNTKNDYGRIYIYPGFWNDSYLSRLRNGIVIDGDRVNSQSNTWDYHGTTEHPVALACAPSNSDVIGTKNCLIAWNDSGAPRGRLLYSYFELSCNSSQQCTLLQGNPALRGGNTTDPAFDLVGPPSAGWFDGSFWLAWKSPDGKIRLSKKAKYGNWTTTVYNTSGDTVDTPSFHYIPDENKQSTLFWTVPSGP